jgi:hypothetical protein
MVDKYRALHIRRLQITIFIRSVLFLWNVELLINGLFIY